MKPLSLFLALITLTGALCFGKFDFSEAKNSIEVAQHKISEVNFTLPENQLEKLWLRTDVNGTLIIIDTEEYPYNQINIDIDTAKELQRWLKEVYGD